MGAKNWSQEEVAYLEDNWGKKTIKSIANKLGRSEQGVIQKASKLGLGAYLENGEYITWNQLIVALGITGGRGYMNISWIKNKSFPVKYKTVRNNKFKVVYLEDFWKWADENRNMIDWSKVEENILGTEPKWVPMQRKSDFIKNTKVKSTPWTKEEDQHLKDLLKKFKYSYIDLSKILHRTEGAIQRRICDLKIIERPLKADNHIKWTEEEYIKLSDMIKKRFNYELMSEALGKSAKAIRGRVYNSYLTENIDKVAAMIGDGKWGDGRPERPITHRLLNADEKLQVKNDLTKFAGILKGLICSQYEEKDFWQRELCMKWDNACTAGEISCDSCTSFERIRPQYCRRCGATVIKRKKIDMCDRCKVDRKKQYQRKFMVLNGAKVDIEG